MRAFRPAFFVRDKALITIYYGIGRKERQHKTKVDTGTNGAYLLLIGGGG